MFISLIKNKNISLIFCKGKQTFLITQVFLPFFYLLSILFVISLYFYSKKNKNTYKIQHFCMTLLTFSHSLIFIYMQIKSYITTLFMHKITTHSQWFNELTIKVQRIQMALLLKLCHFVCVCMFFLVPLQGF